MFIFNIAQVLILNVTETVENYSNLEIFHFCLSVQQEIKLF